MSYFGNIQLGDILDIKFTTVGATGAPTALAGHFLAAYPGNSTTEIVAGITLTVDFDSRTGLNNARVTATGANGYVTGTNYGLVLISGSVGGVSVVGYEVGSFSIENRVGLMPTVHGMRLDVSAGGEAGIDWANIGSPTTSQTLSSTTVGTATAVTTVNGLAANVITATSINADAITAAKIANGAIDAATFAAGAIDAAAIANGAIDAATFAAGAIDAAAIADGAIDANTFAAGAITAAAIAADAIGASELAADAVTEIQSGLATAAALATVDDFLDTEIAAIITTLGTPAGASISADILVIDNLVDDLESRVGTPSDLGSGATVAANLVDIEGQTDDIGTAGAGLTALATQASVNTIDDFLDTEIAAIITTLGTPAGASISADIAAIEAQTDDIGAAGAGLTALASAANLATVAGYLDTEIAAIKAVTDLLPDAGALTTIQADLDNIQTRIPAALVSGRIDASVGAMAANTLTASALATDAVNEIVDTVWDELTNDHLVTGSFGQALGPLRSGILQTGTASTITLDAGASSTDDFYNNTLVFITSGVGAGQSRIISDYVGSTRVATVNGNWTVNPVPASAFVILPFGSIPGASAPTVQQIVDGVWDEAIAGHLDAGSTGEALNAAGGAGDPWITALPGAYGAGTAGKIVGDNINATISSRASQTSLDTLDDFVDTEVAAIKAKTDNLPSDPADASDITSSFTTVNTKLDTIDDFLDTEVAAIKAKTDNLPSDPADESSIQGTLATIAGYLDTEIAAIKTVTDALPNAGALTTIQSDLDNIQTRLPAALVSGRMDSSVGAMATDVLTAAALNADAVTEIQSGLSTLTAAQVWDLSNGVETGLTPRQAMRLLAAALAGKLSGAATTTVTIRNAVVDGTDRIVATVDSDGNRTAIVYNLS